MNVDFRLLKQTINPHKFIGVMNMTILAFKLAAESNAVADSFGIGSSTHRDRLGLIIPRHFLIGF